MISKSVDVEISIRSGVLFCKSRLSKMTPIKTNNNMKWTTLLKTNFWWQETFLLGLKRFLPSKDPTNAICLWLSHDEEHCTFNQQCSWSWHSQRQIAFLGPYLVKISFWAQRQSFMSSKVGPQKCCQFFVFVCLNWGHIT